MTTQSRLRYLVPSCLAVLLALSLLLITSLAFAVPAKPANTIVVNSGDSIQTAINSASPGDTILINSGRYTESLTLGKAVSLTGVSSATVVIHAQPFQRVLTVTGSLIDRSVVISGLTFTGGDITADSPDASKGGGVYFTGSAQPSLHNVTVIDNIARNGGGIYADARSSLILHRVRIESNIATNQGGGAYAPVTVTLEECSIVDNHGDLSGGMYGAVMTLTNTEFVSNSARTGSGGLLLMPDSGMSYSSLTRGKFERNDPEGLVSVGSLAISGTLFIRNTKGGASCRTCFVTNGWFERNTGTALAGGDNVVLTDSVFLQNTGGMAGGVDAYTAKVNGGAFIHNTSSVGALLAGTLDLSGTQFISNTGSGVATLFAARITGARFEGNQSTDGGGLYARYALALTNTTFINNSATNNGGGVYHFYVYDSDFGNVTDDARIVNSLFAHNIAGGTGSALYLRGAGKVSILHTTVADSALNSRAALIVSGTVGITNTIIANHAVGIERIGGTVYEDYNLFSGNIKNLSGTISSGTHHLVGSPNFVDPAHTDYHLGFGSAAIDAGADVGVSADLDGNPRPVRTGYDIGAYEYQGYHVYLPLIRK